MKCNESGFIGWILGESLPSAFAGQPQNECGGRHVAKDVRMCIGICAVMLCITSQMSFHRFTTRLTSDR
jgi:hypothetical protein